MSELLQEEIILQDNQWISDFYKNEFIQTNKSEIEIDEILQSKGYHTKVIYLVDIYKDSVVESILRKCKDLDAVCLGILGARQSIVFLAIKNKLELELKDE